MTNLPKLEAIAADPGLLKSLELDALAALTEAARESKAVAEAVAKAITAEIEDRYSAKISEAYRAEAKDTGTVHIFDGPFDLTIDRTKRVEWDQALLSEAGDKIAAAGDDPLEYLERKLSVSERKFTAWPAHIRAVFEAARTVKPGPLTVKIGRRVGMGREAA
jgi:hypothetical protein